MLVHSVTGLPDQQASSLHSTLVCMDEVCMACGLQVCTILESRMWRKGDLRSRDENDELSRRIAELEDRAHSSGKVSPVEGKPQQQAIEEDDLLDQVQLMPPEHQQSHLE